MKAINEVREQFFSATVTRINDTEVPMIDSIKGVVHTQQRNQSTGTEASTRPRPRSSATDTVEISDVAALHESEGRHTDITIKVKCGDFEAQRLIERAAFKRKLLGLE
jgi:hypothetical protein